MPIKAPNYPERGPCEPQINEEPIDVPEEAPITVPIILPETVPVPVAPEAVPA